MQPARFDAWTRAVRRSSIAASRRGLVIGAVGALLGGAPVAARGRCLKKGAKCDPGKPGKCCSCHCNSHFRCGPLDLIGGCTGATNACTGPAVECPGRPSGEVFRCVVTQDGQPFCGTVFACVACSTDADCQRKDFGARYPQLGRCIRPCPSVCPPGTDGACVYPC